MRRDAADATTNRHAGRAETARRRRGDGAETEAETDGGGTSRGERIVTSRAKSGVTGGGRVRYLTAPSDGLGKQCGAKHNTSVSNGS